MFPTRLYSCYLLSWVLALCQLLNFLSWLPGWTYLWSTLTAAPCHPSVSLEAVTGRMTPPILKNSLGGLWKGTNGPWASQLLTLLVTLAVALVLRTKATGPKPPFLPPLLLLVLHFLLDLCALLPFLLVLSLLLPLPPAPPLLPPPFICCCSARD